MTKKDLFFCLFAGLPSSFSPSFPSFSFSCPVLLWFKGFFNLIHLTDHPDAVVYIKTHPLSLRSYPLDLTTAEWEDEKAIGDTGRRVHYRSAEGKNKRCIYIICE